MKNYQREYPLLSACGLNCGLCPRYHTDGSSKCPGCGGEGFFSKHPSCGIISCSRRHGIEYCYLCDEYPCKKYDGVNLVDSFITHRNMLKDFEKAKTEGLDNYKTMLNEKVDTLHFLLDNYNDGRRKNFYCIAVNLLDLQDVKSVVKQIAIETEERNLTLKEKALIAANLFQAMAEQRNIVLKLNKKTNK